jgi:hypothetical protein
VPCLGLVGRAWWPHSPPRGQGQSHPLRRHGPRPPPRQRPLHETYPAEHAAGASSLPSVGAPWASGGPAGSLASRPRATWRGTCRQGQTAGHMRDVQCPDPGTSNHHSNNSRNTRSCRAVQPGMECSEGLGQGVLHPHHVLSPGQNVVNVGPGEHAPKGLRDVRGRRGDGHGAHSEETTNHGRMPRWKRVHVRE